MKAAIIIGGGALACAALVYASTTGTQPGQVTTQPEEIDQAKALSYGVGYYLGGEVRSGLEADGIEADAEKVIEGFIDGLQDLESSYDEDALDAILRAVHEEMQLRRAQRLMETDPEFRQLAEDNAAQSAAFMQANAQRNGVSELAEGVQYEVLNAGDGAEAADATLVVVTFELSTMDGTVFLAGDTDEVNLNYVRESARNLVRQMRVGDHWRVVMAPERAYGLGGLMPDVGPNEALILDVELLEVR